MSDGSAAGALGGGDNGQGGGQGGDDGGAAAAAAAAAGAGGDNGGIISPAPALPSWMDTLAADSPLRQNADLLRLGSVEDVAKAYAETRTWAKGRIAIPTDEAGWSELGQKLRPETPEGYKFEVPDGQDATLANTYAQFAFDTGIPPVWAEASVKFLNQQTAQQQSLVQQQNDSAIEAVKIEFGPAGFAMRAEAVGKMLAGAGIAGVDVIDGLQQMLSTDADGKVVPGAGAAIRALFTLAEKTGELGKVDGADVQLRMGTMAPAAAQAEINRRSGDMSVEGRQWMARASEKGSAENKVWNDLNMAIARGA